GNWYIPNNLPVTNPPIIQSTNYPIHQLPNPPITQSTNYPIHHSTNTQSTNIQSTNNQSPNLHHWK
ncbi:hypothetical protein, partial [Arcicella aurantiaca]|uniref:hypothetical protein n=1 Tax=Arcicella aurantiaca TaxID=591202 RepID=UPI001B876052